MIKGKKIVPKPDYIGLINKQLPFFAKSPSYWGSIQYYLSYAGIGSICIHIRNDAKYPQYVWKYFQEEFLGLRLTITR